jgi:hypothetical protein
MAPGLRFVRGGPKEHHPLPHVNDERWPRVTNKEGNMNRLND